MPCLYGMKVQCFVELVTTRIDTGFVSQSKSLKCIFMNVRKHLIVKILSRLYLNFSDRLYTYRISLTYQVGSVNVNDSLIEKIPRHFNSAFYSDF